MNIPITNLDKISQKNQPNKKRTIKDFYKIKNIGRGAYGQVLLVVEIETQKIYAMKKLDKKKICLKKQVPNIYTERKILKQIEHPFVVKLAYSFQDKKNLYFIMEYSPGGELFNLLQKSTKFTEDQARFYAAQIVLALEIIHQNNFIYRDLKPENVLIDVQGYIRIADFGLSKETINNQMSTSICGTAEYIAPETLKKAGYGYEVDYWALGGLIYEMVSGDPPFSKNIKENFNNYSQYNKEIFHRILHSDNEIPQILSNSGQDLLQKLLVKDPQKRLGHNGIDEIKNHSWFSCINWEALIRKQYTAPFKPNVESAYDVQNFDNDQTGKPINEDSSDSGDDYDDHFPDFSFDFFKNKQKKIQEEAQQKYIIKDLNQLQIEENIFQKDEENIGQLSFQSSPLNSIPQQQNKFIGQINQQSLKIKQQNNCTEVDCIKNKKK